MVIKFFDFVYLEFEPVDLDKLLLWYTWLSVRLLQKVHPVLGNAWQLLDEGLFGWGDQSEVVWEASMILKALNWCCTSAKTHVHLGIEDLALTQVLCRPHGLPPCNQLFFCCRLNRREQQTFLASSSIFRSPWSQDVPLNPLYTLSSLLVVLVCRCVGPEAVLGDLELSFVEADEDIILFFILLVNMHFCRVREKDRNTLLWLDRLSHDVLM